MRALGRRVNRGVAVLAVLGLFVAACGDDDDAAGDDTEAPDGTGATTADEGDGGGGDGEQASLSISFNSIRDGKGSEEAAWIEDWVIPEFVKAKEAEGVDVEVKFEPNGVDDEQYKSKIALDFRSDKGADIVGLDGIWVGEFAQAGYIEPLAELVPASESWDGWEQIPDAVQELGRFDGALYGIPSGTDGRVLFYNKDLFAEAGLPADWQPTTWQEILDAGEALAELDGVTPIQINAGTAMGEATTMQGLLPLLAGVSGEVYADGKWAGDTPALQDALGFYADVYGSDLGDPLLQQEAQGRDKSFAKFGDGEIGILAESDYFWRDVVNPNAESPLAPMENRDEVVGYALMPAKEPGAGLRGQDFVSMSGGGVRVVNPNSDNPELAWELLAFMNSAESIKAGLEAGPRVTQRTDVNDEILTDDPFLGFIAEEVLPITAFRPGLEEYPQVSIAMQEATAAVVDGTAPADAAADYATALADIVGDDNVAD